MFLNVIQSHEDLAVFDSASEDELEAAEDTMTSQRWSGIAISTKLGIPQDDEPT